ncbi:MAG TPA: ABC transporter ATP-binding protein [Actinomycetota bacterium]|nr:ABC transporter ATP-binding protein [Actinomycetota bacterium]
MRTLPREDVGLREAAVDLRGVTRLFGEVPGVVRVDLAIERGEAVVLRGPNGAGKSTLLRIVATSLSPTYGGGSVLGFDIAHEREQIRRGCELLTHRTRLYEELTARENLRLFADLLAIERDRVDDALERVGLARDADERVRGFSHGMRQKVAVARTIVRDPELLLLDEPVTGLDDSARAVVDAMILDAAAQGRTIVIATHHAVTHGLTARVVSMREGHVEGQT